MSKLAVLLMFSLVLIAQDSDFSSRDRNQIIINTQRLNDIERRMQQIEQGGSALANSTSARTSVNDIHINNIEQELRDIKAVIVGVTVFTLTHLVGFVIYLLKNRISNGQAHRKS